MKTGVAALMIGAAILSLTSMVAAQVEQSSNSNVQQNANVDGGDANIEQSSSVRTETNEGTAEYEMEQSVRQEDGETVDVDRDVRRNVEGFDNDSVAYDYEQTVENGSDGVSVSQSLSSAINNLESETEQADEAASGANQDDPAYANASASTAGNTENTAATTGQAAGSSSLDSLLAQFSASLQQVIASLL